jgi:hypothetical protein
MAAFLYNSTHLLYVKCYDMTDEKNVSLKTRLALIVVGALLAPFATLFLFILITFVTGLGASRYLGALEMTIIMIVVAPAVGASVGYLIGKRKISLNSSNEINQLIK